MLTPPRLFQVYQTLPKGTGIVTPHRALKFYQGEKKGADCKNGPPAPVSFRSQKCITSVSPELCMDPLSSLAHPNQLITLPYGRSRLAWNFAPVGEINYGESKLGRKSGCAKRRLR